MPIADDGFRHKGLKELFVEGRSAKIQTGLQKRAMQILDTLDAADTLTDCRYVRDFHELKGDRKGTYSMHVNGNWVITFKWDGKNFMNIDLEDFHSR